MAAPLGLDAWWDETLNLGGGGCLAISPGCLNYYAAQIAGTKTWPFAGSAGIHEGVTVKRGKRRIFNGKVTVVPDSHPLWTWPLKWKGAKNPNFIRGEKPRRTVTAWRDKDSGLHVTYDAT